MFRVLFYGIFCFFFCSAVAAKGIDAVYEKPRNASIWGDILEAVFDQKGLGKSYALVVGVAEYEHMRDLPTKQDPIRMRDYLLDEAGYDYVHVLTEDQVTTERIRSIISGDLEKKIGPNDRFLLYWSGHGVTAKGSRGREMGFLATNGSTEDDLSSMVGMREINGWTDWLAAKQTLFILDACFSGHGGVVAQSVTRRKLDQMAKESRHIFTAGTRDQRTFASESFQGGVFTRAILDGVSGDADVEFKGERDGIVTVNELEVYVKNRVDQEVRNHSWNSDLSPQLYGLGSNEGEFFFLATARKEKALVPSGHEATGEFVHGIPMSVAKENSAEGETAEIPSLPSTDPNSDALSCHRLATQRFRPWSADSTYVHFWQMDAEEALPACESAFEAYPDDHRLAEQYLRALYRWAIKYREHGKIDRYFALGQRLCSQGNDYACVMLAEGYSRTSFARSRNLKRSTELREDACAKNVEVACLGLEWDLRQGKFDQTRFMRSFDLAKSLCSQGVVSGCARLGYHYERGFVVPQDFEQAAALYDAECNENQIGWACGTLGRLYEKGLGVPKNSQQALLLYEMGCQFGGSWSCRRVGFALRDGIGQVPDAAAHFSHFELLCTQGDQSACTAVAYAHETGTGTPKDENEAARRYVELCRQNEGWACGRLAKMHAEDRVFPKDETEAFRLYLKGCDLEDDWSCYRAGAALRDGKGVSANSRRANEIFGAECARRKITSCVYLGYAYEKGLGVEKDLPRAQSLFEFACKNKEAWGCARLADATREGLTEAPDRQRGFDLFSEACGLGNWWACRQVARSYRDGDGVSENPALARQLFEKQCDQGDQDACVYWGRMLRDANGGAENLPKAQELFEAACGDDNQWGCGQLANLLSKSANSESEFKRVAKLYSQACRAGQDWTCDSGGELHIDGSIGYIDYAVADELFNLGCREGDTNSCRLSRELRQNEEANVALAINTFKANCLVRRSVFACEEGVAAANSLDSPVAYRETAQEMYRVLLEIAEGDCRRSASNCSYYLDVLTIQNPDLPTTRAPSQAQPIEIVDGVAVPIIVEEPLVQNFSQLDKVTQDRALALLREKCAEGPNSACSALIDLVDSGHVSEEEGLAAANKLCVAGQRADKCSELGFAYADRNGNPRFDPLKAADYFRISCDLSFHGDCGYLAWLMDRFPDAWRNAGRQSEINPGELYLHSLENGSSFAIRNANGITERTAKEIQSALRQRGTYKGPIDGQIGPITISAMKATCNC